MFAMGTLAAIVLAWVPHAGPISGTAIQRRIHAPIMQAGSPGGAGAPGGAGGAAAAKAMEMLGKMGMQAVSTAKPGEVPVTKEFVSTVTIKHKRVIQAVDGGSVTDYMRLPVDQYAIYDDRLMRKLTEEEGGDGEIFELSLPTMRPRDVNTFVPKPKLRVRVTPEDDRVSLSSVGASIFGGANELPPNVTAEQMSAANEQLKGVFDLGLNTTLAWSEDVRGGAAGDTTLQCRTDVRLKICLPAPFTRAPRPFVQGLFGLVMKFVGGAILPRFAGLLEVDYQRWCNGTRNMSGFGSLALDDDGYLVVPDQVLQKMKSAPGGAERLALAGETLDLEGSATEEPRDGDSASAPVSAPRGVVSKGAETKRKKTNTKGRAKKSGKRK